MQESQLGRYLGSRRELASVLEGCESLAAAAPAFLAQVGELTGCEAAALWSPDDRGTMTLTASWGDPPSGGWPQRLEGLSTAGLPDGANGVVVGQASHPLALAAFTAAGEPSADQEALFVASTDQLAAFGAIRVAEAELREQEELTAEAERARNHLAEVVYGSEDAVMSKDLEGVVTSWNPAAERMYGYTAEEAIGRHISFLIPPDHRGEEMEILRRVCGGERLETYETERLRADGARISVSLTVSQIRNPLRGVVGASVIARDVTAEKRRRRAQEFLVAASRLLDTSLDPAQTARTIVGTAVPELAEICVIDFVREDGWLGDSIVAGANPEMAARLEEIRRRSPLDPKGQHPVARVLREDRPMIWRELSSPGVVEDIAQNEDHRQLMSDAGYNSAAVVALRARGRTLGALSFLHAEPDLRYDDRDLDFLAELGDRAAMALDNARLYSERDRIAENLQRGLRPGGPEPVPGLDVAVVFEAAGEGIEIGGDFYDVLPTEDGCWILIGDVAGKGSTAAGVSVAARHSVAGLTRVIAEPEEVLARVNDLLLAGTTLNDFATAQLLRLRRDGATWRLTLAGAGHPPAIHSGADGVRQLGGGALLGAYEEAEVSRHEVELAPGETLVLCTDGWLEAGPTATHEDPDALASMVELTADVSLDELAARLRADAVRRGGDSLRDDMVILAIRPSAGETGAAAGGEGTARAASARARA
ncbi:MAG: SpoIIE family protein phosphatase [Solirubrobacterales bacterium]